MRGQFGLSVQQQLMAGTAALVMMVSASPAMAQTRTFDVPAQSAARSIPTFAKQAGIQIVASGNSVRGKRTNAVRGSYTVTEGLRLLLEGTGLTASPTGSNGMITIQTDSTSGEDQAGGAAANDKSADIVVTGSRVRNGNSTSPVRVVNRQEIERSGYSQTGDIVRSLPESFNGGQNPGVIGASNSNIQNQNMSNASTVNLRGLGTDATLVLINGRRLSPNGVFQGADISMIPISALQRVEVVTDGASAIYGSDAVAGVANFILRKDYDGLQLSSKVGDSTGGGGFLQNYNVLWGDSTSDGYSLINLTYTKQDGILATQRSLTASATPSNFLLSPSEQASAYFSYGKNISDSVALSIDGIISRNSSTLIVQYGDNYPLYTNDTKSSFQMVSPELNFSVSDNWKLKLTGSYSNSVVDRVAKTSSSLTARRYQNTIYYLEAAIDGVVADLPGGNLSAALGGGYRQEKYNQNYIDRSDYISVGRKVAYAFLEVDAPVVSPSDDRFGMNELELNFSARAERYSDVGSSTNPRIGLRYKPLPSVTIKATLGRSFKAPSFIQMYETSDAYLSPPSWFGYTGSGTALLLLGANKDLKPEKSASWTVSGEYSPKSIPTLKVGISYYNINFTNRVVQPVTPWTNSLNDSTFGDFITWNPSTSLLGNAISSANNFYNYSGTDYIPASVVALIDDRYVNATSQKIHGIDFSYRQTFRIDSVDIDTFSNMTWTELSQKTIPSQSATTLSGTLYNVPTFRARSGATLSKGGFSATGTINYISSEKDTGLSPSKRISSWTTVDANFSYRFNKVSGIEKGLGVSLSISNLLDKAPPRAESPAQNYQGMYFDSTNTSSVGRFITFSVSKDF